MWILLPKPIIQTKNKRLQCIMGTNRIKASLDILPGCCLCTLITKKEKQQQQQKNALLMYKWAVSMNLDTHPHKKKPLCQFKGENLRFVLLFFKTHTEMHKHTHKSIPLPTIINPRTLRSASLYYKLPPSSLQQSGNIELKSLIQPSAHSQPPLQNTYSQTHTH